jgi:hypothetical protein
MQVQKSLQAKIRKFGSKQLQEITVGDKPVLVSYKTPVAIKIGGELFVTTQKFSTTTSKHITHYMSDLIKSGQKFEVVRVEHKVIQEMVRNICGLVVPWS